MLRVFRWNYIFSGFSEKIVVATGSACEKDKCDAPPPSVSTLWVQSWAHYTVRLTRQVVTTSLGMDTVCRAGPGHAIRHHGLCPQRHLQLSTCTLILYNNRLTSVDVHLVHNEVGTHTRTTPRAHTHVHTHSKHKHTHNTYTHAHALTSGSVHTQVHA